MPLTIFAFFACSLHNAAAQACEYIHTLKKLSHWNSTLATSIPQAFNSSSRIDGSGYAKPVSIVVLMIVMKLEILIAVISLACAVSDWFKNRWWSNLCGGLYLPRIWNSGYARDLNIFYMLSIHLVHVIDLVMWERLSVILYWKTHVHMKLTSWNVGYMILYVICFAKFVSQSACKVPMNLIVS